MNCIDVEIDEAAIAVSEAELAMVVTAVETILKLEGYVANRYAEVTVLLTGDARLRQLNRDFAGEDHATDVLSFDAETNAGFPDHEGDDVHSVRLGDIAISVPQTKRQAIDKGLSFERELAMLAIHGTLHLIGYDHAELDEERVMFGKTDDALDEVFAFGE
ncbi:MAG: rRNA maturation RNase YbeY [Chloroflexi bacterium]|nr:rRNA maturation RNase YbeY [Chloroflexota bacterium]